MAVGLFPSPGWRLTAQPHCPAGLDRGAPEISPLLCHFPSLRHFLRTFLALCFPFPMRAAFLPSRSGLYHILCLLLVTCYILRSRGLRGRDCTCGLPFLLHAGHGHLGFAPRRATFYACPDVRHLTTRRLLYALTYHRTAPPSWVPLIRVPHLRYIPPHRCCWRTYAVGHHNAIFTVNKLHGFAGCPQVPVLLSPTAYVLVAEPLVTG